MIDLLYNDERTAGVIPLVTFLGDRGVTVGFSALHRGLGKHGEAISLPGRFGGQYVKVYDPIQVHVGRAPELQLRGVVRD